MKTLLFQTSLLLGLAGFILPVRAGPILDELRAEAGPQVREQDTPPVGEPASAGGAQGYVFKAESDEVVLPISVTDTQQQLVANLPPSAFRVYEDGVLQKIKSFRFEDAPVSIGILIDNSGSMKNIRPAVNQASLLLIRKSNPKDDIFIADFDTEVGLLQDYTSDIGLLRRGLNNISAGDKGTAFLDAVVISCKHLRQGRGRKRVLVVISDGIENSSRLYNADSALDELRRMEAPAIYTIAVQDGENSGNSKSDRDEAKLLLSLFSQETGGETFVPRDTGDLDQIVDRIARDVRSQYTIHYKPSKPLTQGGYRMVLVEVAVPGGAKLRARTRVGYLAGGQK